MAYDITNSGDTHGIVARILRTHDAHHGGYVGDAIALRGKAMHSEMVNGPSIRIENTLRRIIENGSLATPEQSQWAKWWLERNAAGNPPPLEPEQQTWLDRWHQEQEATNDTHFSVTANQR